MALHSVTRLPRNPAVGWLPVTLSGVSAEVFRHAQLTGLLWWPTIALPIGASRLHAADGMVITTTVDCTGLAFSPGGSTNPVRPNLLVFLSLP